MKIAAQPMLAQSMGVLAREGARPATQRGERAQAASTPTQMRAETPAPARPSDGPPGLQRVLARLEAMGEAGRTPGQTQALDRISRNLARYLENQAMAPLPPPQPLPQPDPVAEGLPDTSTDTPADMVADTPTETPGDGVGAVEDPAPGAGAADVADAPEEAPPAA